jgi:hypothetical protein
MTDLRSRAISPDEIEACDVARVLFDVQASKAAAVERGEAVRVEIPVVVGPIGYFACEVDTVYSTQEAPTMADARRIAKSFSTDETYRGTPYVVSVTLPAYAAPEAKDVIGEVTPC